MSDVLLLEVNERWFKSLGSSPVQLILSVAKQPFKELRYATLGILLNLGPQLWAQRLMSKEPGMYIISLFI